MAGSSALTGGGAKRGFRDFVIGALLVGGLQALVAAVGGGQLAEILALTVAWTVLKVTGRLSPVVNGVVGSTAVFLGIYYTIGTARGVVGAYLPMLIAFLFATVVLLQALRVSQWALELETGLARGKLEEMARSGEDAFEAAFGRIRGRASLSSAPPNLAAVDRHISDAKAFVAKVKANGDTGLEAQLATARNHFPDDVVDTLRDAYLLYAARLSAEEGDEAWWELLATAPRLPTVQMATVLYARAMREADRRVYGGVRMFTVGSFADFVRDSAAYSKLIARGILFAVVKNKP
jgi:hypothetical protein